MYLFTIYLQVSCTVTFDPITEGPHIHNALNYFQYKLKGISFLPRLAKGAYAQMPYEEINEEMYNNEISLLKPLKFKKIIPIDKLQPLAERGCDTDTCSI